MIFTLFFISSSKSFSLITFPLIARYFSIEELRHIFEAVEQHIYATEERIKDNHAFDQHSDTHICERNLGELKVAH